MSSHLRNSSGWELLEQKRFAFKYLLFFYYFFVFYKILSYYYYCFYYCYFTNFTSLYYLTNFCSFYNWNYSFYFFSIAFFSLFNSCKFYWSVGLGILSFWVEEISFYLLWLDELLEFCLRTYFERIDFFYFYPLNCFK